MMELHKISIAALCLVLSGCASWLPSSRAETTPFKNYEEARKSVLALVPMKSNKAALEENDFNKLKHPNILLLTHADVVRRYLPSSMLRREDLDPGVIHCLESRDECNGIEVQGTRIARIRSGGFFADFLNFQRRTETTGWKYTAVILMVGDLVVYRSISGQPDINEIEIIHNPLGPLQDIGPSKATTLIPQ